MVYILFILLEIRMLVLRLSRARVVGVEVGDDGEVFNVFWKL